MKNLIVLVALILVVFCFKKDSIDTIKGYEATIGINYPIDYDLYYVPWEASHTMDELDWQGWEIYVPKKNNKQ